MNSNHDGASAGRPHGPDWCYPIAVKIIGEGATPGRTLGRFNDIDDALDAAFDAACGTTEEYSNVLTQVRFVELGCSPQRVSKLPTEALPR